MGPPAAPAFFMLPVKMNPQLGGPLVKGPLYKLIYERGTEVAVTETAGVIGKAAALEGAEEAVQVAGKAVALEGAEVAGKSTSYSLARAAPFVGLVMGIGLGGYRLIYKGQPLRAMAEVGAGALSMIPYYGTAASLSVSASIASYDIYEAVSSQRVLEDPMRDIVEKNKKEFQKNKYGKWGKLRQEINELRQGEAEPGDAARRSTFDVDSVDQPPDAFTGEDFFILEWAEFDYSTSEYCAGEGGGAAGENMYCTNAEGSSSVLKDEMYMRSLRHVYCRNAIAHGISGTDKRMTECQIVGCGNKGNWTLHVITACGQLGVINGCARCNNANATDNPVNFQVNPYGVKVKRDAHFMVLYEETVAVAMRKDEVPYNESKFCFKPEVGPKK